MASKLGLLAAILVVCCRGTLGQRTIQDILRERADLSQLLNFARDTDIYTALGQRDSQFTLFAPSNEAMNQLSPALQREFKGTSVVAKMKKEQLISYHVVLSTDDPPYTVSNLQNGRVETAARNAPKLFFRTYQVGPSSRVYINGARVESGDLQASNGIVHIVNSVLHPIAQKKNAYALLEDSKQETNADKSARIFADLLSQVRFMSGSPFSKLNSDSNYVTMFVPTDRSVTSILTRQRLEELNSNKEAILKLLKRHIIVHPSTSSGNSNDGVQAVWHASLLNEAIENSVFTSRKPKIDAMEGQIQPVRIGNTLYVTNECGMVKVMDLPRKMPETAEGEEEQEEVLNQFSGLSSRYPVTANVTVNNGVVHFVDGLLGYIYNDAIDMIQEDDEISKFKDTVLMSTDFVDRLTVRGDNVVAENNKVTIFAPIDSAFQNLENAGNIDLSQDEELRERVLNMHMLSGVLNLVDITNDTEVETRRVGTKAKFYSDSTGTYVEVDRVRARIIRADVCVKNGIIHYIDNLLGVPYRNLLDEIVELNQLNDLDEAIKLTPEFNTGNRNGLRTIKETLEDPQLSRTVFAPNNDAFRRMRMTAIGRDYIDSANQDKLYYLILRHAPVGEFFIEDNIVGRQSVPNSDNLVVFKQNQDYFIEYNGPYGTAQAKILWRNTRLTNGVMHIIDQVLYVDNIEAFATVGAASHLTQSLILVVIASVLKILL